MKPQLSEELKRRIDESLSLDGKGDYWRSDTGETYYSVMEEMLSKGIDADTALDWITTVASAALEERGG